MTDRLRAAVVGGGIIGTAVARELARRVDDAQVAVLEKEDRLAAHQTGHNSGVVHAGLYYEPGGLKATLCRRGVGLLQQFADKHGIAYEECGKVVVALDERELGRLEAIRERAVANGVPGIRMLDADELRSIEPGATGVRALHSPHTAIVDFRGLTEALAAELRTAGGTVRLRREVVGLTDTGGAVRITTRTAGVARPAERPAGEGWPGSSGRRTRTPTGEDTEETEEYDLVIVCGGLQSDRLARLAGEAPQPRIVPFYGDYFLLAPDQEQLVRGLIYPVPDPRFPFLGVHVTRRVDGAVMLGPNAYLSLGRESYERPRLVPRDVAEAVGFPGFWRFAASNVPAAVRESRTALSAKRFVAEAQRYLPAIDVSRVRRGPRGIRAQAMDARGRLVDDFVITGTDRMVHVRNAPSPGATSSMAIAEHIVDLALERRRS